MTIQFTCPHCGKQTNVADQYAGQTGPCSGCGQTITIPSPAGGPLPAPAGPAPRKSSSTGVVVLAVVGAVFGLLVCSGIPIALLLPAIQAAREAARRTQCSNNLRQIALAMHNYHDAYGSLPPAFIPTEDGQPKHSWRVLILPFLEQSPIYEQYNFDEPWDSPANRAATSFPLPVFCCPSDPRTSDSMDTNYMVVVGPQTAFPGAQAIRFREIPDGTSNTLMVVEVRGTGVHWAEPVDLDAGVPLVPNQHSGDHPDSWHPGGFNAAMCDGSVQFISPSTAATNYPAMLTRNGGEAINFGF